MTQISVCKNLGENGYIGTDSDITYGVEMRTVGFWSNIFCLLLLLIQKKTPYLLSGTNFPNLTEDQKKKVVGYVIQIFGGLCFLVLLSGTGAFSFLFDPYAPMTFDELNAEQIKNYQTAFASGFNIWFYVLFHEMYTLDLRYYIWIHHSAFIIFAIIGYIFLPETMSDLRVIRMSAGGVIISLFEMPLYLHLFLYRIFHHRIISHVYYFLCVLYAFMHLLGTVMWLAYTIETWMNVTDPDGWTHAVCALQLFAITNNLLTAFPGHTAQFALTKKIWILQKEASRGGMIEMEGHIKPNSKIRE